MSPFSARRSAGFALLTGLLLLTILTLVGVVVMQSTSLEYRMSTNTAFQSRTREASESGRMALAAVLPKHTYERSWTGVSLLPGLTIKTDSGIKRDLYGDNSEGVGFSFDPNKPQALTTDADYCIDPAACTNPEDLRAEVRVYRTDTRLDKGSGAAMVAGYEGLGKGAGAGGVVIFFYGASVGKGPGQAEAITSGDTRVRVFN